MEVRDIYDSKAPKKPVNLTANTDLIQKAKKLGVNLSRTFEKAVEDEVRTALEARWRKESKEGIDAYNLRIERHGVFGADTRRF